MALRAIKFYNIANNLTYHFTPGIGSGDACDSSGVVNTNYNDSWYRRKCPITDAGSSIVGQVVQLESPNAGDTITLRTDTIPGGTMQGVSVDSYIFLKLEFNWLNNAMHCRLYSGIKKASDNTNIYSKQFGQNPATSLVGMGFYTTPSYDVISSGQHVGVGITLGFYNETYNYVDLEQNGTTDFATYWIGAAMQWLAKAGNAPGATNTSQTADGIGTIPTSDDIDFRGAIVAPTAGMTRIFSPTETELNHLWDFLWSGNWWQNLIGTTKDPLDYIISLSYCPFKPSVKSAKTQITIGNILGKLSGNLNITMDEVTNRFQTFDMGTIHIDERWGNFLDYAPHTAATIYIPYCGSFPLNIDEIMNADLHLVYMVDVATLDCVASIKVTKDVDGTAVNSILFSFQGNMMSNLTLTSRDDTNPVANGLKSVAPAIGAMAMVGIGANLIGETAAMAVAGEKPDPKESNIPSAASMGLGALLGAGIAKGHTTNVQTSGALSGSSGYLGSQKAYITIVQPERVNPLDYKDFVGYPAAAKAKISELSGYTVVSSAKLDNVSATNEEKKAILEILSGGVYL